MDHHNTLNTPPTGRALLTAAMALAFFGGRAQTLFVADNEFPEQVTNMAALLTSAGVTFDTHTVNAEGDNPPPFSQLDNYDRVIWYTGTDGTNLGFWNGIDDVQNYAFTGRRLWIIGQDLLYAVYATPAIFTPGEFPYDVMGLQNYLAQSYGDDGGLGCPQMNAAPGVSTDFASVLQWIFDTLWWADACEVRDEADDIYQMAGPGYPLAGFASMAHHGDPGLLNVMSTLFEPTYISPGSAGVTFVQQTLAYMDTHTGIGDRQAGTADLRFSANPATDVVTLTCEEPITAIMVHGMQGAEVFATAGLHTTRHDLSVDGLASGVYVVSATTASGQRISRRLMKD